MINDFEYAVRLISKVKVEQVVLI